MRWLHCPRPPIVLGTNTEVWWRFGWHLGLMLAPIWGDEQKRGGFEIYLPFFKFELTAWR